MSDVSSWAAPWQSLGHPETGGRPQVGDEIEVVSGPLRNLRGTITALCSENRVVFVTRSLEQGVRFILAAHQVRVAGA